MFHTNNRWIERQRNRLMDQAKRNLTTHEERCQVCASILRRQHSNTTSILRSNSSLSLPLMVSSNSRSKSSPTPHTNMALASQKLPITNEAIVKTVQRQLNSLCMPCQQAIPWIHHIYCKICGRYEICHDCKRREQTYFIYNRGAVQYDETMKAWLSQFKYRKNERFAPLLIAMLLPAFQQVWHALAKQDQANIALTYIPLNKQRMEERGFNQAEMLARGLAEVSGLPLIPLLSKTRHTHKQSYKSRAERLQDLRGTFRFQQEIGARLPQYFQQKIGHPMNILLVDDVYTTGSTLNEAAKILTHNLPCRIYGITWARS